MPVQDISYFKESSEWQRSVGKRLTKAHFREVDGNRHAVCDWRTGECEVHEDTAHGHKEPLRHLLADCPEALASIGALALSAGILWKRR